MIVQVSPISQSPKPKLNFRQISAPEASTKCLMDGRDLNLSLAALPPCLEPPPPRPPPPPPPLPEAVVEEVSFAAGVWQRLGQDANSLQAVLGQAQQHFEASCSVLS